MPISETIIYGSAQDVKKDLLEQEPLNQIDNYGYTPLVQTAIVNDLEKTRYILEAGADVNMPDLTGRTALHWAAENHNLALCQLLLEQHANPNAYTTAGQSVLVTPLLREQKKLIALLQKHGGDIDFAQDFIQTKLLSHRFELKGRTDIVDPKDTFIEMNYEGFYLEFTISVVLNSLTQFQNNYQMRHFQKYAPLLTKIIECFMVTAELIKLQNYHTKIEEHKSKLKKLFAQDILIIPIACQGHAIIMVRCQNHIIRCDRGEYGRKHGTVILYEMQKPGALTQELLTRLIYKHTTRDDINIELPKKLGLKAILTLPLSEQVAGNCSWANVEAAIPAIILFLAQTDREQLALNFYTAWEHWDQDRALHFCIERFQSTNSPARKASYATLLSAILFQRCDHNNPDDIRRARKILQVVAKTNYKYLLENYYNVYAKNKASQAGENFLKILDDFGIKIS